MPEVKPKTAGIVTYPASRASNSKLKPTIVYYNDSQFYVFGIFGRGTAQSYNLVPVAQTPNTSLTQQIPASLCSLVQGKGKTSLKNKPTGLSGTSKLNANTASISDFTQVGFPPTVATSIVNGRPPRGGFKDATSFIEFVSAIPQADGLDVDAIVKLVSFERA